MIIVIYTLFQGNLEFISHFLEGFNLLSGLPDKDQARDSTLIHFVRLVILFLTFFLTFGTCGLMCIFGLFMSISGRRTSNQGMQPDPG